MTRTEATRANGATALRFPAGEARYTGWTRGTLADFADRLLLATSAHASQRGALIALPGPEGGYGARVDGLEGFARTFLLAGFRVAGERGDDPHGYAERYADGIAAGVDPDSPERWVRLDEHPQAKVEAASIALILDMTRPWLWEHLTARTQQQVVEYLAPAVGDHTYPRINWVWFRLVVQTFLRSVGGPWSADDVAEDLATHDGFARADGWMADGAERAYDHYVGWALHLYPTLWARMAGADDLAVGRQARDVAVLDRYLTDAVALVGADGAPLVQGRSLIYRFAAAAPFWVGAMAQVPSTSPGVLRRAAVGVVKHFHDHGVPDARGLLTTGWYHEWPGLAQSYSGPGSPYWASKGLLGLALPADHPVWTADEEPLPVERGDVLRAIAAPGWVVSGTSDDGVVRVANHGTDHAVPGSTSADSPLYARLGYSTVTSPLLDEQAWSDPLEQSVALLDGAGRASHRTGMALLRCEVQGEDHPVAVASSRVQAHWVDPAADQQRHGSGWTGAAEDAGTLRVTSLVRGPWEVRVIQVEALAPRATHVRVGGWPITATAPGGARELVASVTPLLGSGRSSTVTRSGASPLGDPAVVELVTFPAEAGSPVVVAVSLRCANPSPSIGATPAPVELYRLHEGQVTLIWPDGIRTRTTIA
jgi:hypothetical protein